MSNKAAHVLTLAAITALRLAGPAAAEDPGQTLRRLLAAEPERSGSAAIPAAYYFACRAILAGSPVPCAASPAALAPGCERLFREAELMRVPPGSPQAAGLCQDLEKTVRDLEPSRVDWFCSQGLSGTSDARDVCKRLLPTGTDPRHEATCAAKIRLYRGQAADCRDFENDPWNAVDRPLCRAVIALRAGARKPECAQDPLCAAMAAEPADCASYARNAIALLKPAAAATADVVPQRARFPYRARIPSRFWLGAAPAHGQDADAGDDAGPAALPVAMGACSADWTIVPEENAGPNAYPYIRDGVIHPPRAYHAETRYSKADLDRIYRGLRTAQRYADINNAFADGYRMEDKFDPGMGIHMHNLGYIMGGKVEIEKPEFLTYVFNRRNGRFQLAQMGYIQRGHLDQKPYHLFDTPQAHGHFHRDICVRVEHNLIVDAPDGDCKAPGDVHVGPIWMMHFAVNIYNERGMFADYFPYVNYLSRHALSYSFFGAPIP